HEAKSYAPAVEPEILTVLLHPSYVGLGEIGLHYHCATTGICPALAVDCGIPITALTWEAEEYMERIMKEIMP
ncbi:hypothetical protein EDD85DRAFT_964217, partial [Armillaria nabsnona]